MFRGYRIYVTALIAFVAFGMIAVNPVGRFTHRRAASVAPDAGVASAVALATFRQHYPSAPHPARKLVKKPLVLTPGQQLSGVLSDLQAEAKRAHLRGDPKQVSQAELSSLAHAMDRLAPLRAQVEASFQETGRSLKAHAVPAEMVQRNDAALKEFAAREDELTRLLRPFARVRAGSPDAVRSLNRLQAFFDRHGEHTSPQVDLKHLPFRPASASVRAPVVSADQLPAALAETSTSQTSVASTPVPADLAPTADVQLSQAVQDLASSLGNNPVRIFNWVRNNVAWIPTYGSVQGSETTLVRKQGNDVDTASLLIALYRAAGIPARYVYGTIDVPAAQVMNWVGGAATPQAAQQMLAQGGIPNVALVGSDGLAAIRIEHVWVEAYVDVAPSRGGVQRSSDTWVALDPSFKQYQFTAPRDVSALSLGTSDAAKQWVAAAAVDPTAQSITHLDQAVMDDWVGEMPSHLEDTFGADWNLADFAGGRVIRAEERTVLPLSLPNTLVSRTAAYSSLPDGLRHKVSLTLYGSELDRAFDSPSLTYSVSLAEIAGKRLGVTYVPATDTDAATLQSYRDANATTLPLYLIHVVPVVKVDDLEVARGASVTMGQTQLWDVALVDPGIPNTGPHSYHLSAGDEIVVGVDGNGLDQDVIHQRFSSRPSDTAAENLNTIAMYYWAQYDALDDAIAAAKNTLVVRLPSVGMFSAPLTVSSLFGIPYQGHYGARVMDVGDSLVGAAEKSNGPTVEFVRLSGTMGSFLEGRTFDGLLGRELGSGASAVQLIREADEQQIPIHLVTADNYAVVAPHLQIDADTQSEIANAVQAGKQVLVPERAPVHGHWSGLGYIVEDPSTGAAAYLIKGALHGGADDPCDVEPGAEPKPVPLVEILIVALIIIAFILLVLALPELVAAAGAAIEAAGAALEAVAPILARLGIVLAIGSAATPAAAGAAPAPRPGDGMSPPGDCTYAEHQALQAAVDLYCHGAYSCRSTSDCAELATRRQRWSDCAQARTLINTKCFRGGNTSHYDEEVSAYTHVYTCECRAAGLGCP